MTASERGGGDPRAISLRHERTVGRTRPRQRRPDGTREEAVFTRSRKRRGTTSVTPGTTVIWTSDGARTVELVVGLGDDLLHRLGGELGVLACARTRMTARRRQIDHARMTARRPIACTPTADRSIARHRRRRNQSPRLGVAAKPTAAEPDPTPAVCSAGCFGVRRTFLACVKSSSSSPPTTAAKDRARSGWDGTEHTHRHRTKTKKKTKKRAVRGLSGEHHGVRAVEHRVADVRHLGARRARVAAHGLEHLRRDDDGLAGLVALAHHPLLDDEQLGERDLRAVQRVRARGRPTGARDGRGVLSSRSPTPLFARRHARRLSNGRPKRVRTERERRTSPPRSNGWWKRVRDGPRRL